MGRPLPSSPRRSVAILIGYRDIVGGALGWRAGGPHSRMVLPSARHTPQLPLVCGGCHQLPINGRGQACGWRGGGRRFWEDKKWPEEMRPSLNCISHSFGEGGARSRGGNACAKELFSVRPGRPLISSVCRLFPMHRGSSLVRSPPQGGPERREESHRTAARVGLGRAPVGTRWRLPANRRRLTYSSHHLTDNRRWPSSSRRGYFRGPSGVFRYCQSCTPSAGPILAASHEIRTWNHGH